MESQRNPRIAKTNLDKEQQTWKSFTDFKTYYKVIIIKTGIKTDTLTNETEYTAQK